MHIRRCVYVSIENVHMLLSSIIFMPRIILLRKHSLFLNILYVYLSMHVMLTNIIFLALCITPSHILTSIRAQNSVIQENTCNQYLIQK